MTKIHTLEDLKRFLEYFQKMARESNEKTEGKPRSREYQFSGGELNAYTEALRLLAELMTSRKHPEKPFRYRVSAAFHGEPDSSLLGYSMEKMFTNPADANRCYELLANDPQVMAVELYEERLTRHN